MTIEGVEYRTNAEVPQHWEMFTGGKWVGTPCGLVLTALAEEQAESAAKCAQRVKLMEQNAKLIGCVVALEVIARNSGYIHSADNAAETLKEIEG